VLTINNSVNNTVWYLEGNVLQTYANGGSSVWQRGNGRIEFNDTDDASRPRDFEVDFTGLTLEAIKINRDAEAIGKVVFLSDVTAYAMVASVGTFDLQGHDLTLDGNLIVEGAGVAGKKGNVDAAGLAGSHITVGGYFDARGALADEITLDAPDRWWLDVALSSGTRDYLRVKWCDAREGATITGTHIHDEGYTLNWAQARRLYSFRTDSNDSYHYQIDGGGSEAIVSDYPGDAAYSYGACIGSAYQQDMPFYYWATNNPSEATILRAGLDGSNPTILVTRTGTYAGINTLTIDPVRDYLYWTEQYAPSSYRLMRCDLDGSNITTIVDPIEQPHTNGLVVDWDASCVFYLANSGLRKVDLTTLVDSLYSNAAELTAGSTNLMYDSGRRRVYWVCMGGTRGVYWRSTVGSSNGTIVLFDTSGYLYGGCYSAQSDCIYLDRDTTWPDGEIRTIHVDSPAAPALLYTSPRNRPLAYYEDPLP
ncbi:MAG: hypothetical protein ACYDH4_11375, partial [Candidatus Cryosericum sp.]